jgi:hypothetical protein
MMLNKKMRGEDGWLRYHQQRLSGATGGNQRLHRGGPGGGSKLALKANEKTAMKMYSTGDKVL